MTYSPLNVRWPRSRTAIEIDITYACNLRCNNCNRSCSQAPSSLRMSVSQIKKFISESITDGQQWENIRILGGEPTLHPQLLEICTLLDQYRSRHNPEVRLQLLTNGYGSHIGKVLASLPDAISVCNSAKDSASQPYFCTFNIAPADLPEFEGCDFTMGCWVCQNCGIGLTPYGFYQCAVAGGIDRIFGFNLGIKHLPRAEDDLHELMRTFCRLCGRFKPHEAVIDGRSEFMSPTNQQQMQSPTWRKAYAAYQRSPPELSLY